MNETRTQVLLLMLMGVVILLMVAIAGLFIRMNQLQREVLLVFSSMKCPACAEVWPHLKTFGEPVEDVQVVMISRGSAEENRQLMEEQGFDFPVLAGDDAVAQDYQAPRVPFFYVIDGKGMIANAGFAGTLEQLEALVAARVE